MGGAATSSENAASSRPSGPSRTARRRAGSTATSRRRAWTWIRRSEKIIRTRSATMGMLKSVDWGIA
jgi:hypothetical protein